MSYLPYKVTAIARSDNGDLNIIPGATVTVLNSTGGYATLREADFTTPIPNPFNCDENGERQIYLQGGSYAFSVDGGQSWEVRLSGASDIQSVETIAELKALTSANHMQGYAVLYGYNAGLFYYNAGATGAETFERIIPDTLPGRYIKVDSSTAKVVFNGLSAPITNHLGGLADKGLLNVTDDADANLFDSTEIVASPPAGFAWDPEFTIYRNRSGKFECSVDPRRFIPQSPTTVIYVDIVNGSDANSGVSPSQPYKTLAAALAGAAYTGGSGGAIIYIGAGFYSATESLSLGAITRPTALICPNGVARITGGIRAGDVSWTQASAPNTSVYSTSLSTYGDAVWDESVITEQGYYTQYSVKSSISEVQAQAGSSYYDADTGTLYVRPLAAGAPSDSIYITRNSAIPTGHTTTQPLYCENISFELARACVAVGSGPAGPVIFNKCQFLYMQDNGLETNYRAGLIYLFDCNAARNGRDGLNYEYEGSDRGQRVLEVNCTAELNGWKVTGSNNGSTGHEYVVIIRVNGWYDRNADRNLHDVHFCQSWNLGCYSGRSTATSTELWRSFNYGVGRQNDTDNAQIWLDSCTSQGSNVDLYAGVGCTIYTRRMSAKTNAGDGSVIPY